MAHVVLLYHIIWRTKRSERTINENHERDLYAYINGFCINKKCQLIRINGMSDHLHMLMEIPPEYSVSDVVKILKVGTSKWMKEHSELFPNFDGWGNGYAAFTYSERDKGMIRQYIMNQKVHHKTKTFREEYEAMLQEWGIDPTKDFFLRDD